MPERIRFFLGANSAEGFVSFQEEYLTPERRRRIYILKGGPGTGKSGMMKALGRRGEAAGLPVEYYACSSDPASLDAVVFPTLGAAMIDGTAPHVVEPACIGAVEEYVSLCPLWDRAKIVPHRAEIDAIRIAARARYAQAGRYLSAAAQLRANVLDAALGGASPEALARRGRALARRYIPAERRPGGRVSKRFLSGLTPEGCVCFGGTVYAACRTVAVLTDRLGLAPFVLAPVLSAAKAAGLHALACFCPLNPKKLEHILLPELSVAFVTSSPEHPFEPRGARSVRCDRIPEKAYLDARRETLREDERRARALTAEACGCLREAKVLHDRLEGFYTPAVDFAALDRLTGRIAGELGL